MNNSYDSELESKAREFRASTKLKWEEVEREWKHRSRRKVIFRWLGASGIAAAIIGALLLFPGLPSSTDQNILEYQAANIQDLRAEESTFFTAAELRGMYKTKD